ncbi:MAG: Rrf2 family transcriptional regulator [Chthonomonas sp.]|nr:Rrf2 family transcriptional regulator [Chthonomonas sp.]
MKLSAQEEYGLRCLLALGSLPEGRSMTIPEFAVREGISQPLAAKTLTCLRKLGYIKSTRGQLGGYILARPATEIMLGAVMAELGGRLYSDEFCDRFTINDQACVHRGHCLLHGVYEKVQGAIDRALDGVSLAHILPAPEPMVRATSLASPRPQ